MRAGLFVSYITNFSARTVKEFYGKIQGKNLETGHLRLCGRNREQRIRRRRWNVGGALARKDGHALAKGARHGNFGHSSRFAAHFILYAIKGIYDFSVLIPTALGVTFGGFLGAKLLGKLPQKTVGILFGCLQVFAGAWLFFFR